MLCKTAGSRLPPNSPKFEYEGAFRSWLLRILIDEALIILGEKEQSTSDGNAGNRHHY